MIYNHAFPLKKCQYNSNNKPWITPGIKISSQRKRELYLFYRSTKDSKLKNYYKRYCRILPDVIKTAKKLYYNNLIINSNNKSKTSWHIINLETNKTKCNHDISSIEIDGKICNDYLDIAKAFNTYFSAITGKIYTNTSENPPPIPDNVHPLNYLKQVFSRPFPSINLAPTTTKEVTDMVKSLKSKNSHGYDKISIKVLKLSLPCIISPLIYICNK